LHVEVHKKAHGQPRKTQVRHDLRFMNGQELFDGFELEHDPILDDNVEAVATVQQESLVGDCQCALSFEAELSEPQLFAEARLVSRLQEAWP
jgi:hypothetical protein